MGKGPVVEHFLQNRRQYIPFCVAVYGCKVVVAFVYILRNERVFVKGWRI